MQNNELASEAPTADTVRGPGSRAGAAGAWLGRHLPWVLCSCIVAYFLFCFAWLSVRRLFYPYDLEWMEGGMLDHVARILSGQPLYVAPSIEFVPYIYNPLYYYVAAGLALVTGTEIFTLRLVSVIATLVTFVLIFELVRRETRRVLPGILGAGFYAATYPLTGAWFDVARVDSLCIALCLGALIAARTSCTSRGVILSAVLSALAFATKQTALAIVPALGLYLWLARGLPAAVLYSALTLVIALSTMLGLHLASDGWSSYYTLRMPAGFASLPEQAEHFLRVELFASVPVALCLGLYALLSPHSEWREGRAFHALTSGALLLCAYTSRSHAGSYLNDTMAAYAALAILFGLGFHSIIEDGAERSARVPLATALVLLQLAALLYAPNRWAPNRRDVREGDRLLAFIKQQAGDVLVTTSGSHLPRAAGKPSFAQAVAVNDVHRSTIDWNDAKQRLSRSCETAFRDQRFSAVIQAEGEGSPLMWLARQHYAEVPAPFLTDPGALRPRSGTPARPALLFVRRTER